jgi:cytochrome c-type biogenesis protein CcmF
VIDFQSVDKKSEKNFQAIVGKFEIKELDNKSVILNPELRVYNQPNIVTSEADIKTNLLKDRFITMNLVSNQDYFNIRYQDKPFMIWIWLSVLLISFAGLLSLLKKKYEN